jgi:hypothetical protein
MNSGDSGNTAVAKKKARGVGKLVRIDPSIVTKARVVAASRGETIGDYISNMIRANVSRDYLKEIRQLEKEGGQA